jgi:exopolysaccharide biosynthesis protein
MFKRRSKAVIALLVCLVMGSGGYSVYKWRNPTPPPVGQTSARLVEAFMQQEKALEASQAGLGAVEVHGEGSDPRWAIYGFSFDPAKAGYTLEATVGPGVYRNETVEELARGMPAGLGKPVAAINGDYFELPEYHYPGTLQGLCITQGEMAAGPARAVFWIDAENKGRVGTINGKFQVIWPDATTSKFGLNCATTDFESRVRVMPLVLYTAKFGATTQTGEGRELVLEPMGADALPLKPAGRFQARVAAVNHGGNSAIPRDGLVLSVAKKGEETTPKVVVGDTLTISVECTPEMAGVKTAVSAAPVLVAGGKIPETVTHGERAPRTAIGVRADGRVVCVVVDGRQPRWSIGMTMLELANWMQMIGCTEAMNLDGGGSTTFWYEGKVLNSPSDGKLRPVGNALVLMKKP